MKHRPVLTAWLTPYAEDKCWWAVVLGRQAPKRITGASNGCLRWVRNLPVSIRAKGSLTASIPKVDAGAKAGPNEPQCLIDWRLVLTEKLPRG